MLMFPCDHISIPILAHMLFVWSPECEGSCISLEIAMCRTRLHYTHFSELSCLILFNGIFIFIVSLQMKQWSQLLVPLKVILAPWCCLYNGASSNTQRRARVHTQTHTHKSNLKCVEFHAGLVFWVFLVFSGSASGAAQTPWMGRQTI